jgi:hypothetical protein
MADDRVVVANRASPRETVQGDHPPDHPRSMLSFASGSAIKRITAGVKARRWFSLPGLLRRPAFTLLVYSLSNEKRKMQSVDSWPPSLRIGRYKGTYQDLSLEMMCKSRSNRQIGLQGRVISGYMGTHNSFLACTQLPIWPLSAVKARREAHSSFGPVTLCDSGTDPPRTQLS